MKNTLQRYGLPGYLQISRVIYNILQHVLIDIAYSLTILSLKDIITLDTKYK